MGFKKCTLDEKENNSHNRSTNNERLKPKCETTQYFGFRIHIIINEDTHSTLTFL